MSETPKQHPQSDPPPASTIAPQAEEKKSFPVKHTPEPWYLRSLSLNFPFAITTDPEPDLSFTGVREFHTIALITRECRVKPIDTTPEEVLANAELLVRAPRLLRILRQISDCYTTAQPGSTPWKDAWNDADEMLRDLQKAGVF